jgi:hypothetical protein
LPKFENSQHWDPPVRLSQHGSTEAQQRRHHGKIIEAAQPALDDIAAASRAAWDVR